MTYIDIVLFRIYLWYNEYMGKKQLIVCPNCKEKGIKQTMAEMLPSGLVSIQRFHHKQYGKDCTLIGGSNFYLICGHCGHKVFIRKNEKKVHNSRE